MKNKIFIIILFVSFFFVFISCKKDIDVNTDDNNINIEEQDDDNKEEENKEIYYDVRFIAGNGGEISGTVNQTVLDGASSFPVKAIPYDGYDFYGWSDGSKELVYVIDAVDHDIEVTALFKKAIYEYPEIFINTDNNAEITSKDTYINCNIYINDNKNPEYCLDFTSARIKGRGNSTWDKPKKPYRIKFDEKIDLFGNGKNKDWTLIANYIDLSMIRNYLAYTIGNSLDHLPYTTSCQFVELYLNGKYPGLYLLCEQVEVGKNRVEIDDKLGGDVSFLVELDNKYDDDDVLGIDYFYVNNQPYSIKAPKTDENGFNKDDCDKIKNYLESCLKIVKEKSYKEITEVIDVNTFADGYIINELFGNVDVNWTSWYLCKDKNGLLMNGPIWDFDISCGNMDYNDQAKASNKLFANTNTWYKYLLRHNEFKILVREKLIKYYPMFKEIIAREIDSIMKYKDYFLKNFERWDIIGKKEWPHPDDIVKITSWEGHVEYVEKWLDAKLEYMISVYCREFD